MRLLTTSAAVMAIVSIGIGSANAAMMAGAIDKAFVTGATQSNLGEIAAGKLALKKSSSPMVRSLGKQFIDDHTKANGMLGPIAHAQGLMTPTMPSAMQMATASALKKFTGSRFDTMWLKTEETGHEKTIALFKSEISSGTDTQLVAFATKTLPVIEGHLLKLTSAATMPARSMASPSGMMASPSGMMASPSGMMASPSGMMASPSGMMASPNAMMSPKPNSSPT